MYQRVQTSKQNEHNITYHNIEYRKKKLTPIFDPVSIFYTSNGGWITRRGTGRHDTTRTSSIPQLSYVMLCNTTLRTERDETDIIQRTFGWYDNLTCNVMHYMCIRTPAPVRQHNTQIHVKYSRTN